MSNRAGVHQQERIPLGDLSALRSSTGFTISAALLAWTRTWIPVYAARLKQAAVSTREYRLEPCGSHWTPRALVSLLWITTWVSWQNRGLFASDQTLISSPQGPGCKPGDAERRRFAGLEDKIFCRHGENGSAHYPDWGLPGGIPKNC